MSRRSLGRPGVAALAAAVLLGAGMLVPSSVEGAPVHTVTTARSPQSRALAAYAAMTPKERIGQLMMVGVPTAGISSSQRAMLVRYRVGNVVLAGPSKASVKKVRTRTDLMHRQLRHDGVDPYVAVDHEGGYVQRLTGPGFSRLPTALVQGRSDASTLRASAKRWGKQLAAAGVDLNLSPVADTVPAKGARSNLPIGQYEREYGHTVARVTSRVAAMVRGMSAARTDTAVKHFPGLGRATGNTDWDAHVTDPTGRHSSYIRPFAAAIDAGAPFVMVSSAVYPKIDAKHPACFSRTVMVAMLRGDLDFDGVVISDALNAAQLRSVSRGTRATRFVAAGGTMIITADSGDVAPMTAALRTKAASDSAFAAKVKAAVLKVLVAKARDGLLA